MEYTMDIFKNEAISLEIGGNNPVLLNDAESVFLVDSGRVDIFSVHLKDGEPEGIGNHIFRLEAGEALFGIDFGCVEKKIGLFAKGIAGTRLLKLKQSRLRELATTSAYTKEIIHLLDNWITGLYKGIGTEKRPKNYIQLQPEKETLLEKHEIAYPKTGLIWVKHITGNTKLMGIRELPLINEDIFFPVTNNIWLQSVDKSKLFSVDTETLLAKDPSWVGLEIFHRVVLSCVLVQEGKAVNAEHERIRKKVKMDLQFVRSSLLNITSVLGKAESGQFISYEKGNDLFTACQFVGNALGMELKPVPDTKNEVQQQNPVDVIARASKIRKRTVALKDKWWCHDNGPLWLI
jgi:hypothetical protein